MQVKTVSPYIDRLLAAEPWRSEVGETTGQLCKGTVEELEWDGGNKWHCLACGRIGHSAFPGHEMPPKSPARLSLQDLIKHYAQEASTAR
jgi:hypothetical protein